jgi:hypothetical protein
VEKGVEVVDGMEADLQGDRKLIWQPLEIENA